QQVLHQNQWADIEPIPGALIVNIMDLLQHIHGLDAMLHNGPWFIRNNPLILKKWHPDENLWKEDVSTVSVWVKLHGGRSIYARVMIEPRADYEWKPLRCSSCKVFGHIHEECPKYTGAGEKKTVKKPSQISRGVPVGPKMGYKPQKEYRPVLKKPNASSSGDKKKGVEPTIEFSNSNPFDVFNSVDNDVDLGTNQGTTNLENNGATSSGSSFIHINNDWEFASNTPIGIVESNSEAEVVFDETANLRISTSGKAGSDKGYDTNSLLEQWRDYYPDNDDYDQYDDDMYENHDLSEHMQSICDDLDITIHGKKKK
ncbi:nucleotide-diphospho-sugar transferase, partial [Tanacetum coccineum]